MRRAVDKFNEENDLNTIIQHEEFSKRRSSKQKRKQEIDTDRQLALYRRLYVPTLICLLLGTVFSFGGTLRGLSEKTFLWRYREIFCIIGPIFLTLGVVLLFVSIALITHRRKEVGRFIALRKSLKTLSSRRSSFVSLPSSIGSSDKMCHSLEDLDTVCDHSSTSFLSANANATDRKLSLSNSQVSFSETVRVHKIQTDTERVEKEKEEEEHLLPEYPRSLVDTSLPYKSESVSYRVLEGVLRAQKSIKNGNRTLGKYKDQLHVKPTVFSSREFVLQLNPRHQRKVSSNSKAAAQRAMSKLRILRVLQSGGVQTTEIPSEENLPLQSKHLCSLEQNYAAGSEIQNNPLSMTEPQFPCIYTDNKNVTEGDNHVTRSPVYFSLQPPLQKNNDSDRYEVHQCNEIQVIIHPPEDHKDTKTEETENEVVC